MINNGIFSQQAYEERIHQVTGLIHEADAILIGAGAGLSTAAGLQYGGKRFKENFGEFIQKYGAYYMTDMYSAGFYPYPSEEAKWGYWSKHALMNRFEISALPLYKQLYDIVRQYISCCCPWSAVVFGGGNINLFVVTRSVPVILSNTTWTNGLLCVVWCSVF